MKIIHMGILSLFAGPVLQHLPHRPAVFVQAFGNNVNILSRRAAFSKSTTPSTSTITTLVQHSPFLLHKTTTATRLYSTSSSSSSSPLLATSFDDGVSPYYITTPIYYVNDVPHIGHAYTSTACDVLARFMRLSGREVFFLSGTDEHGQKVETSAGLKNIPPQQFVDEVSKNFRELLTLMNISNDYFVRTTDEQHKKAVQHLWKTLVDNGAIYLGNYEGWYSVRDECYYTESELVDGKAPTGADVEWVVKEPSYFFKLSEYEDRLLQFYEDQKDFIAPDSRRNEVLSFVKSGLRDLSVSRTSFQWGVQVPDDDDHVMYVWIDALANYISALGYSDDDGSDSKYNKFWPASCHIVGKDILRFHAVYWPAFLMAADLPLPKRLFAHGWWTKDGEKISKSLGNVIDPIELCDKYGVDQTRFFLMAEVTFGGDGDFSHEAMIRKVNSNLANELGNLCQRTLSMVFKNCDKAVPTIDPSLYTKEDKLVLEKAKTLRAVTSDHMSTQQIHRYCEAMVSMVWDANKYVDDMAPWALKKTDVGRMEVVLYVLMELLRHIAILYQPLIPDSANLILDQLAVPQNERSFDHLDTCTIQYGAEVKKPQGVFPRLEVLPELVES